MTAVIERSFSRFDDEHAHVIALLVARGAGSIPHPGGVLLDHLRRTARRLDSWGASPELVVAGLCHAAYGTQGFPTPLLDMANREVLRRAIGDAAEAIVYGYCALDRVFQRAGNAPVSRRSDESRERSASADATRHEGVPAGLASADATFDHGHILAGEMRDRFSGEYWTASDLMRRQLAELSVANELDVIEHTADSGEQLLAIAAMISAVGSWLSQAAWSAAVTERRLYEKLQHDAAPSGDVDLAYRDLGLNGPRVLLWHGGGAPELTWSRQHSLASSFALRIPWRRGSPPSAAAPRQDWSADVQDLLRVMPEGAHVVAHSYGGVSAMVAASIAPERFGSLVVIEAPLWSAATENDVEVQQLAALGRAFANGAPEARAAFLALAALPDAHPETGRIERLAKNVRDPGEARPAFDRLRSSGLPIAFVSGAHNAAIERLSDALSSEIGAERWVVPGSGHAVQRQPEFNVRLSAFVSGAAR